LVGRKTLLDYAQKLHLTDETLVGYGPYKDLNIEKLKEIIWEKLKDLPKTESVQIEEFEFDKRDKESLEILRNDDGSFELKGGYIDNLIRGIVLSDFISFAYFQKRLKNDGVIEKLKEKGLKDGDTIHIKDVSFEYVE
jgi:Obg family GTPase CgtA-like protein